MDWRAAEPEGDPALAMGDAATVHPRAVFPYLQADWFWHVSLQLALYITTGNLIVH